MTAVQGIIAAGTVAYLTREATWEKITFSTNHLFYLVGIAAQAAAVEIPHFSLAAKMVFMLTPIALMEHFRQGQVSTEKARAIGHYFNRFYYAAVVVSTVVLAAFGHTAYGVGFFSVMALDMLSRSKRVNVYAKTVFDWSANGVALLTFASYAAKLATPRGQYLMGVTATLVFLPRICKIIQMVLTFLPSSPFTSDNEPTNSDKEPWYEKKPIYPWTKDRQMKFMPYLMAPVGFIPSHSIAGAETGAFIQGLQNLMMGKLPHDQ